MAAKIEIAPALIARAHYLYEHTDTPVPEIAAMLGMSRWTLHGRIRQWRWTPRLYPKGEGLVASPVSRQEPEEEHPVQNSAAPSEPPVSFAERLSRVIEAQMQVAERTLKVLGPASPAEAERTARILATVSRTVQEITATAKGHSAADDTDDDAVPRDMDAFRDELARRISGLVEEAERRRTGVVAVGSAGES